MSLIPEFWEIVPAILLALLIGTSLQFMWSKAFEQLQDSDIMRNKMDYIDAGETGEQNNDLEMGPVRKRKSKKKKRKSGTANKIKESRSLIGQAKYMLKNKFMPGNGHNQMMGELRSQSLMGDKDHDTFEFETGNYKPLELNTEEGAPKIKID